MQLVHTFVKGSQTFTDDMQMPLQSDAHVYFDPRHAMINTALHSASADLLTCSARLAGVPIQLLLDSGASDNFISEDFARRMGFSKRQSSSPQHLTFADGSSASVSGVVHSRLRLGNNVFCLASCCSTLREF